MAAIQSIVFTNDMIDDVTVIPSAAVVPPIVKLDTAGGVSDIENVGYHKPICLRPLHQRPKPPLCVHAEIDSL